MVKVLKKSTQRKCDFESEVELVHIDLGNSKDFSLHLGRTSAEKSAINTLFVFAHCQCYNVLDTCDTVIRG